MLRQEGDGRELRGARLASASCGCKAKNRSRQYNFNCIHRAVALSAIWSFGVFRDVEVRVRGAHNLSRAADRMPGLHIAGFGTAEATG